MLQLRMLFLSGLLLVAPAAQAFAAMPKPVLRFEGTEEYQTGGKTWVRYKLSVVNRADFFAPAPDLPPCGANTKAARAWVDVFNGRKPYARIYGFCALGAPDDLAQLWFAVEKGKRPPSRVFIKIDDRLTSTIVSSNRVATH